MTKHFGGFGGFPGTLNFEVDYKADNFAQDLKEALGSQMMTDERFCQRVWAALANVDWIHECGDTASYSFRAAGDLIASILNEGDYMDWYCCTEPGCVDIEIQHKMSDLGWSFTEV